MKKHNILLTILFALISFSTVTAQEVPVEMADIMRSNGKIYVVVGVLLLIFLGIVVYLIRLEKKISTKEKQD